MVPGAAVGSGSGSGSDTPPEFDVSMSVRDLKAAVSRAGLQAEAAGLEKRELVALLQRRGREQKQGQEQGQGEGQGARGGGVGEEWEAEAEVVSLD
jgi:hypothetical protein